ncbi:MAG: crossover junction endodeoxyribonuclease RuvC [Candidatus Solincola sediminis]|uniref:Crossover junction endodeoxyribonuclease RuvC n=1 Tax=Candidatus Solincola sediminis TaxID=1797199 RepID=A0A1F2WFX1_9ACTN|nr:MAG: crossover junction endodeoxyribonuclease RuvC [Candidatus Solincola sediminis]OFW58115.1 MAG: crossover junction endodeoxyribonuclease RuvC [Candidatus Solincola sediminis]
MIIMGIDPGLSFTGFGVVEKDGDTLRPFGFGGITTSSKDSMSFRLAKIYGEVKELVERYQPDLLVLEALFFNTNVRSAMLVGQARGGIILAAEHSGIAVEEYTPLQVKQCLVGHGRADKNQVKYMVRTLLHIEEDIKSSHASDALALAICHAHHEKMRRQVEAAVRRPKP